MELNAIRDCERIEVHTPHVISQIEAAMVGESEKGGLGHPASVRSLGAET